MAPMILEFILGDLMERNLRRAMAINDGSNQLPVGTAADGLRSLT